MSASESSKSFALSGCEANSGYWEASGPLTRTWRCDPALRGFRLSSFCPRLICLMASSRLGRDFVFYGDLNCPFCFAQHERLHSLGAHKEVRWHGIQHMPDLPVPIRPDDEVRRTLAGEVEEVSRRLPDLPITGPLDRPNSGPATRAVAEASLVDEQAAARLATELYRALWVHARDISNPNVIVEISKRLDCSVAHTSEGGRLVRAWQQEWEQAEFERRIPAIKSPRGERLLGLSDERVVKAFLASGSLSSDWPGTCEGS